MGSADRTPALALTGLDIADPPERWARLGFAVDGDGDLTVGAVRIRLGFAPPGGGIVGWALEGIAGDGDIGGLPTTSAVCGVATGHPNHALAVDHVVVATPDLDAFGAELTAHGLGLRRWAEIRGRRMGFRRLGGPVLEVVESPDAERATFWGVTFAVATPAALDALCAARPRDVGAPHPAVQPGRRIATVTVDAGLSTQVAFIDPADDGLGVR